MNDTDVAPDATATVAVTMTATELNKVVADAIARAMKAAGFNGQEKARSPPKVGYTMKEAASVSGVGRTTLYKALRQHELRSVKKGARRIILHRDLQRWLEGLPPSNV
jgi:excisionase family DNA binding protein